MEERKKGWGWGSGDKEEERMASLADFDVKTKSNTPV